jgi:hypothetical protein
VGKDTGKQAGRDQSRPYALHYPRGLISSLDGFKASTTPPHQGRGQRGPYSWRRVVIVVIRIVYSALLGLFALDHPVAGSAALQAIDGGDALLHDA